MAIDGIRATNSALTFQDFHPTCIGGVGACPRAGVTAAAAQPREELMIPMGLTDRQAHTLAVITRLMAERRCAPSVREIMTAAGLGSTGSVYAILCQLRTRGYVRWLNGKDRSLTLTPRAPGAFAPGAFVLPGALAAAVDRFCAATGSDPAALVTEAVAFHLDQVERT